MDRRIGYGLSKAKAVDDTPLGDADRGTTKMSDTIRIDYLLDFDIPSEDQKVYMASVKSFLFQILNGLRWIKDKPGHTLAIWTDLPEHPIYFELSWEDEIECRIELHDIDYGLLGDIKNFVGLVQLPGLFTRSLDREKAEYEEIKEAIREIMEEGRQK